MNVHSLPGAHMELHDKSDKRQAILCATLSLLSTHGFHGFSMKQLAEQAGVACGTVYLYFKDREALIAELHSLIIKAFSDAAFTGLDDTASLREQHRMICLNIWRFCIDNPGITLSKGQFDHLPPDILKHQFNDGWALFQPMKKLFESGRMQQLIRPLPDHVLIRLALDPFIVLAREQLLGIIELDASQHDQIVAASWDAITLSAPDIDEP